MTVNTRWLREAGTEELWAMAQFASHQCRYWKPTSEWLGNQKKSDHYGWIDQAICNEIGRRVDERFKE